MAPQCTAMNGRSARLECWWMSRARVPLPTPVSPVKSTVVRVGATRRSLRKTSCMSGELVWLTSWESRFQNRPRR